MEKLSTSKAKVNHPEKKYLKQKEQCQENRRFESKMLYTAIAYDVYESANSSGSLGPGCGRSDRHESFCRRVSWQTVQTKSTV
jgi:hypothetical protein